jgi:hypothetical protein
VSACDPLFVDCNGKRLDFLFFDVQRAVLACGRPARPPAVKYGADCPLGDCVETGQKALNTDTGKIDRICCNGEWLPIGPPPPPPPVCPEFIWEGTAGSGMTGSWSYTGSGGPVTFPVDGSDGTLITAGTPDDPSEIYSDDIETTFMLTSEACLDLVDPSTLLTVRYDALHAAPGGDIAYEIHLFNGSVSGTNSLAGPNLGADTQSMQVAAGSPYVAEWVEFEVTLADALAGMVFHTHSLGQTFPGANLGELVDAAQLSIDLSPLSVPCGCA